MQHTYLTYILKFLMLGNNFLTANLKYKCTLLHTKTGFNTIK
jgi:hypothetical protein